MAKPPPTEQRLVARKYWRRGKAIASLKLELFPPPDVTRLFVLATRHGLSAETLATKAGISFSTLEAAYSGKPVSMTTASQIVAALNLAINKGDHTIKGRYSVSDIFELSDKREA